ncbi:MULTISPECIES: TIGR02530 family flagellar biosynthesis protein [Pseudobutyrivibrio]|uniref:Flagellar operon protein n=2 Tax=Pseudobutyrivibrio xylanivorans TaxID=185007 RepID=A0A1M6EK01_PSEXY|nr:MULTISPECIES: TIGR02530 family flagellar biosynthesis protein [Pseudobutyrivibrio]MDC7278202.1 flagellar protein [Butyrivibrio fibrisolvens]SCZ78475.1 flagellar operon protein [Pseudobutyrivibrio xylanivorans]SHI85774.1 flagellar operon protein [Pseudobutyrivibrio xylanivorans DSM 14809]
MSNLNINPNFTSIEKVAGTYLNPAAESRPLGNLNGASFEDIFKQKLQSASELKFSKHAAQRLDDRNIELTEEQSLRLEEGVMKASEKGITDSLVLVDTLAFIVNVPNQTVVTAMDQTESDENIFTNIDGAVIV